MYKYVKIYIYKNNAFLPLSMIFENQLRLRMCLINAVKSLKTKIVHTVTKGKKYSAGCTCEEKNHTKTCECVSERNIVTMDECF